MANLLWAVGTVVDVPGQWIGSGFGARATQWVNIKNDTDGKKTVWSYSRKSAWPTASVDLDPGKEEKLVCPYSLHESVCFATSGTYAYLPFSSGDQILVSSIIKQGKEEFNVIGKSSEEIEYEEQMSKGKQSVQSNNEQMQKCRRGFHVRSEEPISNAEVQYSINTDDGTKNSKGIAAGLGAGKKGLATIDFSANLAKDDSQSQGIVQDCHVNYTVYRCLHCGAHCDAAGHSLEDLSVEKCKSLLQVGNK